MTRWTRALLGVAFALALLPRLVVPAGYMPVVTAHGFAIEMCSGHVVSDARVAPVGGDHKPQPHGLDRPCSFTLFSGALGTGSADVPRLDAPLLVPPSTPRVPPLLAQRDPAPVNLPPAIGPPARV